MMVLVSGATVTVRRYLGHPHLGRLVQPNNGNSMAEVAACGCLWAGDNACFTGLDPDKYLAMLDRMAAVDTSRLLFVPPPDVVGDAHGTLALFTAWLPALRRRRLPAALVAQDGLTSERVPWGAIAALFIGGSTAWKEGAAAAALMREAKRRGKWVHVGRCNSIRREQYISAIGADSFDGTSYSMYPDTYIPAALRRLSSPQLALGVF